MTETKVFISKATKRNWDKLKNSGDDRLMRRANKSRSQKTIVPDDYVMAGSLPRFVEELRHQQHPINDLIFSLCAMKIEHNKVDEANAKRFFEEYNGYHRIALEVPRQILKNRFDDWIGFVYQSLMAEGHRILTGLYYTSPAIVEEMLSDVRMTTNQRFLDPCCGSGIFLMKVEGARPEQLYGVDNDPLAVMIAKANLMVKFNESSVYPQIYQLDFLLHAASALAGLKFEYIVTNPPWGSEKRKRHSSDVITSNEQATLFFPESFKFIAESTCLDTIKCYHERFKGVFTDFISMKVRNKTMHGQQSYTVRTAHNEVIRKTWQVQDDDFCAIPLLNDRTEAILDKAERMRHDDLTHSQWALGIITGNNAKVLKDRPRKGLEPIFTGKDIRPYGLKKASRYVKYNRVDFQQCAKDEFYRAKEKLVYKFVSSHLCFTYDDKQRLFLNSANILIPEVDGMSIKTVLAFLNSALFNFLYAKRFNDIKILKGNLSALPFPKITPEQNQQFSALVDRALSGDISAEDEINALVFSLYELDQEEIALIIE